MKLSKSQLEKVAKYFKNKPEITAVYLYGSFARGSARPDSDVDLAILVKDKSGYTGFDTPQTRYLEDLKQVLNKAVEIQDLGSVSIDFAYRIISKGLLVYGKESKLRTKFEEKTIQKYFDIKPFFDEYYKSLSEIARKGELHVRYI